MRVIGVLLGVLAILILPIHTTEAVTSVLEIQQLDFRIAVRVVNCTAAAVADRLQEESDVKIEVFSELRGIYVTSFAQADDWENLIKQVFKGFNTVFVFNARGVFERVIILPSGAGKSHVGNILPADLPGSAELPLFVPMPSPQSGLMPPL